MASASSIIKHVMLSQCHESGLPAATFFTGPQILQPGKGRSQNFQNRLFGAHGRIGTHTARGFLAECPGLSWSGGFLLGGQSLRCTYEGFNASCESARIRAPCTGKWPPLGRVVRSHSAETTQRRPAPIHGGHHATRLHKLVTCGPCQ